MPVLIMTKGLPASGKTTWAKQMVSQTPETYKRVNKDDLRAMLDAGKWSKNNENYVLTVRDYIVKSALEQGKHVIVDDTNLAPKHEKELRDIAQKCNSTFLIQDFTWVSVEECIKRDQQRQAYVGEKVILDMWKKFLKPKEKPVNEAPVNPDLPWVILVDVDGTVAKMNGRGPYEWNKVDTDLPNEPIVRLVKDLYKTDNIVFLSGRDECCRKETDAWLTKYVLPKPVLLMRPAGDTRDDRIVKQEIYEKVIRPNYNVRFVLDDRNKVVDMWRSLGLTCLQVAEGQF